MKFESRLRTWINRDDGKYYRVGNKNLAWYEVVGNLLFVLALGLFLIPNISGEVTKRLAFVSLALALLLLVGGAVAEARDGTEDDL